METFNAPICLFVYTKLEELKQTIYYLKNNYLAKESRLVIFSDAGYDKSSCEKVEKVRLFLKEIDGFEEIVIIYAEKHKGLANSVIDGITFVFKKYEKIIIVEDDLITSPNFLNFMNQALDYFSDKKDIYTISGFSYCLKSIKSTISDFYLGIRASSIGMGIWKDRWETIDWEIKDFNNFKWNFIIRYKFNKGGSDMFRMLKKQKEHKIDSWAIRLCYNQFKQKKYTVFASTSKILYNGYGKEATNSKDYDRFKTTLDDGVKRSFVFTDQLKISKKILKEFRKHYSYRVRIFYFLKRYL